MNGEQNKYSELKACKAQIGDSLFNEARRIINNDRQNQYGSPEDSFKEIAERWTQHIQHSLKHKAPGEEFKLESKDVALMMADLKIARELNKAKKDNIVDACGYLALYEKLHNYLLYNLPTIKIANKGEQI